MPAIVPQCRSNRKVILTYQIEVILSDINHVITFSNLFLSNALVIASLWLIFWLETFSHNSSTAKEQPEKKTLWVILCQYLIIFDLLASSAFRRKSEDAPLLQFFLVPKNKTKKEHASYRNHSELKVSIKGYCLKKVLSSSKLWGNSATTLISLKWRSALKNLEH